MQIEPALLDLLAHHLAGQRAPAAQRVAHHARAAPRRRLTLADVNEEWLAAARRTSRRARTPSRCWMRMAKAYQRRGARSAAPHAESCQWNVSAAAARLHISRRTIYRKIHRHGLLRHAPQLGAAMQEPD